MKTHRTQELLKAATAPFALTDPIVHLTDSEAVAQNLPPVLAETIPQLPALKEKKSIAIVCTDFACRPPVENREELSALVAGSNLREGKASPGVADEMTIAVTSPPKEAAGYAHKVKSQHGRREPASPLLRIGFVQQLDDVRHARIQPLRLIPAANCNMHPTFESRESPD